MATYTVDATVRVLLGAAIAQGSEPALTTTQFDALVTMAAKDEAGVPTWSTARLNRSASIGWQWKAGLVAPEYAKLGGGPGKVLERAEWFNHCMAMSAGYGPGGGFSVDTSDATTTRGIGSMAVVSSTAVY